MRIRVPGRHMRLPGDVGPDAAPLSIPVACPCRGVAPSRGDRGGVRGVQRGAGVGAAAFCHPLSSLSNDQGEPVKWIYQMTRVRVSRGDKLILDDVNLTFLPGAKIGVVG